MFDTAFIKDEAGVTAIEYGGIAGVVFLGIIVPLSYVFEDIKAATDFLVNALSFT